jgi:hypothetical protein
MLLFKQVLHRLILAHVASVDQSGELNAQKLSVLKRHLTRLSHSIVTKTRTHIVVAEHNPKDVEPVDADLQAVKEQAPGTVNASIAETLAEVKQAVQDLGATQSDEQQTDEKQQQQQQQFPSQAEVARVSKMTADIEHTVSSLEKSLPSFLQAVGNLATYLSDQNGKERPVVEAIMNGPPLSTSGKEPSNMSQQAKQSRPNPY